MDIKLIDNFLKEIAKDLGGPGSGNHGHKGRKGKIGGSAPDGTPDSQPMTEGDIWKDKALRATLERPKTMKEWKSALSALSGSGDRRAKIAKILADTGYKYEDTFPGQDVTEVMYTRGKWNIFVDYYHKQNKTKVTVKDSHKGN